MSEGQRRLAAIMFTDMVGYTALGQKKEALSLALVEEQRRVIRPILVRHNGREVKTMGDAFLVEFSSALDAVRCAYDVQRSAREFNLSMTEDKRIRLRVGIHLGDVEESHGDISGDAVNIASRIEPLAEEGGVCLTRQVHDQVANKFELPLRSLGAKSLKNVDSPMGLYKMVMPWEEEDKNNSALEKSRIAILPFTNISANSADEYFADGMTEELISTLSNIAGLQVISRTSVMNFKATPKKIADIAKDLGAGSILEGSVRKAGDKVRVTAQLIDARTDTHVWAKHYDRELRDIFGIQSDISTSIAESLRVKLLDQERERIQKPATTSTEAHLLYMKGRYFWNDRTKASLQRAIGYFEMAIERDSNYALAYSGLADTYSILSDHGYMSSGVAGPKALKYAERAVELDGDLSEGHASLGLALTNHTSETERAAAEFSRAIEINPNNAYAHLWYSLALENPEKAIASAEKASRLDPLNLQINSTLGAAYYKAMKYDEAILQLRKVVEQNPDFPPAHFPLTFAYLKTGKMEEALSEAWAAYRLNPTAKWIVAIVLARTDRKEESQKIADELERSEAYVDPADVAWVYSILGPPEKAVNWLRRALQEHSAHLVYFLEDPSTREFRETPAAMSVLASAGSPRE